MQASDASATSEKPAAHSSGAIAAGPANEGPNAAPLNITFDTIKLPLEKNSGLRQIGADAGGSLL